MYTFIAALRAKTRVLMKVSDTRYAEKSTLTRFVLHWRVTTRIGSASSRK